MADPSFLSMLQKYFVSYTRHVAHCGMTITELSADSAIVELPFREDWLVDIERGLIHPGIVTTLVDSACGAAVLARIGGLEPIATLDLRMDYLRVGRRDLTVYCRAECHRLTPHIAFARATVWQDDPAEPLAQSQGAFMRTKRPAQAKTGAAV
ncbi:MAG TPA: PaaI family thioesterase [Fontimonas sp.]